MNWFIWSIAATIIMVPATMLGFVLAWLMKNGSRFFSELFCDHELIAMSNHRYRITGKNGAKDGEVTLKQIVCTKCGYQCIQPTDRTYGR